MKLETRNRIKHRQAISSFSLTFFLSSGSSSLPSCLMSSFFTSRACSSTQWMSKTVKTNWHSARNWPQISKICIHPHYEVHGVQAGLHQKSCFVLQFPSMTMILVTHFFVFLGPLLGLLEVASLQAFAVPVVCRVYHVMTCRLLSTS